MCEKYGTLSAVKEYAVIPTSPRLSQHLGLFIFATMDEHGKSPDGIDVSGVT
jgi:hypothetical protein